MRSDLPLHVIDTCVFVEALSPRRSETRRACERYLLRSGQTFRPALTAPLLIELVHVARSRDSLGVDRIVDVITALVRSPDAVVVHPKAATFERIAALRALDSRLEEMDAFHLATALDADAAALVTIDPMLLKSATLRKERVVIAHPRRALERPPR